MQHWGQGSAYYQASGSGEPAHCQLYRVLQQQQPWEAEVVLHLVLGAARRALRDILLMVLGAVAGAVASVVASVVGVVPVGSEGGSSSAQDGRQRQARERSARSSGFAQGGTDRLEVAAAVVHQHRHRWAGMEHWPTVHTHRPRDMDVRQVRRVRRVHHGLPVHQDHHQVRQAREGPVESFQAGLGLEHPSHQMHSYHGGPGRVGRDDRREAEGYP